MASYKDIQGFNIQNLSSDPVPFAQEKANNPWAGTWASGGNLNTARHELTATGTQTAGLAIGGENVSNVVVGIVEQYDGSSWTEVADLNTNRKRLAGAGTQTATLAFAGYTGTAFSGATESYNGTNWTSVNSMNTARAVIGGGGTGIQTAALAIAGNLPTYVANVEQWDGTNWTEVADISQAATGVAAFGTTTSAIEAGGYNNTLSPFTPGAAQEWNGSSWSSIPSMNNGRYSAAAAGISTDGIIFGGSTGPNQLAYTESWNGSTWTEVNDLATGRQFLGGRGTGSVAFATGGEASSGRTAVTEEWSFTGIPPSAPAAGYTDAIVGQIYYNSTTGSFKAIKNGGAPIGAWASGGSLNAVNREGGGSGTQTDAINVGGYPYPMTNENYNGTSWSTFTNLNTQRGKNATSGSFPDAITAAGATPTTPGYGTLNLCESWNGSAWTEVADLSSIREAYAMSANGTNTATLVFGGVYSGPSEKALTESWNGTSWTEVNDMNTARYHLSGIGVQTDALAVGGSTATPAVPTANTETWNGTSWTEVNNLNTSRRAAAASSGTSTNALYFGGFIAAAQSVTESWDGTSWTEVADLATARYFLKGSGSGSTSALAFGGNTPTETSATEEWTAGDFQITTLTTS